MDCKTARTLLDFARPNALELEPRDAEELAGHLDHCPDCGASARSARHLDDCLGRAMRQVEVPEKLRNNLMARLDAERGDWYRHRLGHVVRALAVAAAVVLLVWGVVRWRQPGPTKPDLDDFCQTSEQFRISPTTEKVQDALRKLQVEAPAPTDLRYLYLAAPPALTEFQGNRVPLLVFVDSQNRDGSRERDRACVFLLSSQQFDLKSLPAKFTATGNYHYRIAVVRQDEQHSYLVLHTGDDWDWLRAVPSDPAE